MSKSPIDGKIILLTGGTGSFGNKFVEIALKKHNPTAIRIYSRGEQKQVEMERKFNYDPRLRFLVGDVRDKERLSRAMNGVDIVIHAAALKHVPVCEYNPNEAIRTNVKGAMNIVDCAIDNGVEKVVALSTDKAVQPVNLYGATKFVSEKIFQQANVYSGMRKTKFSCVRYGNVVGSNGSVIPLFLEQCKKGEITITDERMTRFWITLEQGVELVLTALNDMSGGEIFIPKIPSVKITDLADVMAPGVKRKIIGIRPGEKIHEALISVDEARHTKKTSKYYLIEPEFPYWKGSHFVCSTHLPDGFYYTSDNNDWWLTKEELKQLLKSQDML
jgi:UDP-N-acetylglucosamine 4,6-dehydratase (inverting)